MSTISSRRIHFKSGMVATLLLACGFVTMNAFAADEELVTFYPAYGYREGDDWVIPMRFWVHERRATVEKLTTKIASSMGDFTPEELTNFRARIRDFAMDSESGEAVAFKFDRDPEGKIYRCPEDFQKTDLNGLVEGAIVRLPVAKASVLLSRQDSRDGWLSYHATSKQHSGTGKVKLIEPTGLSVISDIDDTVKVTNIPAGTNVVVRNTFFRDFVAAPSMAVTYQSWKGAAFHYVSGSPWQLYGPLSEFLVSDKVGFPEGTFHMRQVSKNLLSGDTWEGLKDLVSDENATFEQKLSQISEIMQRFPERTFILVGDSGERDPEVYREIRRRFSNQVQEIIIRDVVNDKQNNPSRLEGMTIK